MSNKKPSISEMRQTYESGTLYKQDLAQHPIEQFSKWFEEARNTVEISEANAMIVATVDADGMPSSRVVLLKALREDGFVFYTNYESRKGHALTQNPKVALLFFWNALHRQVRIEGTAEKLSREASVQYFQSRPKGSQLGAWASPQSSVIESREVLEEKHKELTEQYKDVEHLPCPENWGGFLIRPHSLEFWQGRPNRLHDRMRYQMVDGKWVVERLAP